MSKKSKLFLAFLLFMTGVGLFVFFRMPPSDDLRMTEEAAFDSKVSASGNSMSVRGKKMPRSTSGFKGISRKNDVSPNRKQNSREQRVDAPESVATSDLSAPSEGAVARVEKFIANFCGEEAVARVKDSPVTDQDQTELKNRFDALSADEKIEQAHHAMNLLPDETVMVVYGVLFDKTQPTEVIDVIFSDLLNRDETIKNPVMEEIVKNKEHPMYVESARILDIVK